MDIIFGDKMEAKGEFSRTTGGGSLSDADLIFGKEGSSYKKSRFGASKSMSVASDSYYGSGIGLKTGSKGSLTTAPSYKIYEGIQNAAFSDYSDSSLSGSSAKITNVASASLNKDKQEEEEEDNFDLK